MAVAAVEAALVASLKELLGNTFVLYLRAHGAHWNVEGSLFPSLHDYFGDFAEDVYSSIDVIAESLRQHYTYAPSTLSHLANLATIPDAQLNFESGALGHVLLSDLRDTNTALRMSLDKAYRLADQAGDLGLANFLQDRMAAHLKHDWQLRVQTEWPKL
jgi:starvation-inducible DNA-binding protein